MTTKMARMAEVLSRSPSTRNIGTTTELSQNVAAKMTKTAVPGGGRWHRGKSGRRRRRRKRCSGRRKAKGVKGPCAVTPKERTPGGRILYSEARRVKFDGTRIVSCKLTNGKKVMNYLRSNKDIGKTKRTRSRTHGGDRKARPITNHDRRRTRGVWGSDGREDTSIRSSVERGTRVGDPLGAGRRRQSHGAEGLCQSGLVPPPRPGRLLAGLSGRGPVRRGEGSNIGEHGRRLELRTRPPSRTLEQPHRDAS